MVGYATYASTSTSDNKTERKCALNRSISMPIDKIDQISSSDLDGLAQQNFLNQTFPPSPTKTRTIVQVSLPKNSIFDDEKRRFNKISASRPASASKTYADNPGSPLQSFCRRQSGRKGSAPSAFNPANKMFNHFKSTTTESAPNSPKWTSVGGESSGLFGHVSSQLSERKSSSASLTQSDSSPSLTRLRSTPKQTHLNPTPRKAGSRIQRAIAFEGNLRANSVDSAQFSESDKKSTRALAVTFANVEQDDRRGLFEKAVKNGISTNLEISSPSSSSPSTSSSNIFSPSTSSSNTSSPRIFSPNTPSPKANSPKIFSSSTPSPKPHLLKVRRDSFNFAGTVRKASMSCDQPIVYTSPNISEGPIEPNTPSPKANSPKIFSSSTPSPKPHLLKVRRDSFNFVGTVRKASMSCDQPIIYTSPNITEGPKKSASPVEVTEEKAVLAVHKTERLELIIPEEVEKVSSKEQKIKEVLDKMKPQSKAQSRAQQLWKKSSEKKKEIVRKQQMESDKDFVVIERGRKFPMKDLMRLKGYFEDIDLDGNGTIDGHELEARIQQTLQDHGERNYGVKMILNTLHANMNFEEFLAANLPSLSKKDIRMCVEALPKRPRVVNDTLKGEIEDVFECWKVYSDPDGCMNFESFEYFLQSIAESSNDPDADFELYESVRNPERGFGLKDFALWRLNMFNSKTHEPLKWEDIEDRIEDLQLGRDIWGNEITNVKEKPERLFTKTSKFSKTWKRIS